jgi:hypothetical protein
MELPTEQELCRAEEIFSEVCRKLPREAKGKMMAIEVASGDTFVGDTETEAFEIATRKYPKRTFVFKRIGSDIPYFVGAF